MTETTRPAAGPGDQWCAVDIGRIRRLPERLRRLWPRELMPRAENEEAGEGPGIAESVLPEDSASGESSRGFDMLTAWLTGFTAELNLTRSRITIVICSEDETVHLEVCLYDDTCLAILALRGEGFEEFEGFELLRRLGPQDLAQATEALCALVEKDCVLTLSYLNEARAAGMEFLHRVDGSWSRPRLERKGEAITVTIQNDVGSTAVRSLLAATLTHLCMTVAGGQP